jgi:DNA polymerase III alpha subunit
MIPQLRIRTEYSFKRCYGPVGQVASALKDLQCPAAGIVDTSGTWGHVQWEKALSAVGVAPLFGTEFAMPMEDGRKPTCWVLAEDMRAFYRLSSTCPRAPQEMAGVQGVVRFAGAALTNPDHFDYIDINPLSRRRTRQALELHRQTGKPMVVTSYNDYPAPADRLRYLAWDDTKRTTIQHIMTDMEIWKFLSQFDHDTVKGILHSTCEAAERCKGVSLEPAPMISVDESGWGELVQEGKRMRLARGHIKDWTDEYQQRLDRELAMIAEKDFVSYFIIVADLVTWSKERMLVGPARGSSAGSLVCYLLQITEVDPLVHGLIFERFIDVNRNDLPDIDIDFNDKKRELSFAYLAEKYGEGNVARIGSVNRLKPRSVIAHVGKKMAIPKHATFAVVNVLVEHSSGDARYGHSLEDTLEDTQPGKDFLQMYPEASLIAELENHASHSGQHAAGIIVSNVPVVERCTVRDGIAHIDKKDAEHLNLLKIDALGLRTLGVIEDSGCITQKELYDLPLDDPEVLRIFDEAKFSGVFQFEGAAQRRVSVQVPMASFKQIDHVTALARPGPLGGGAANTYINRNAGKMETVYKHPSMEAYLGDTHGVVLYQEQVMRIVREIGDFSWQDTSTIRKAMSGRKGEEFFNQYGKRFITGAEKLGIDKDSAAEIWNEICSFGAWGMNKSHTVSYAVISYWCAYMKRYHPLEYAAANLRNAKDDDQTIEVLRELRDEGVNFIPFDADKSELSWVAADGQLVGGYTNLVGIGPVKGANYIKKRNEGRLTEKDREALAKREVKHNDLTPARTLWGHLYDHPEQHNIRGMVKQFGELKDNENAVVICKLLRVDRRDENEVVRASRRGGKLLPGQTLFLDSFVVDDSISKPVLARIKSTNWDRLGEPMADKAVPKQDWFLIRGRWLGQFSMMLIDKIKCLTNPEMFS